MELTRAHLQKELRAREMECERLNVHIKVGWCKLYFDLETKRTKSIGTARKSILRLGKLQSLVAKYCKIRNI